MESSCDVNFKICWHEPEWTQHCTEAFALLILFADEGEDEDVASLVVVVPGGGAMLEMITLR